MRGKICVVTGASSGIGRRTATDLAAAGAIVCVVARRAERLTAVVDAMGGEVAGHSARRCDVSRHDEVKALAAYVQGTYGRCDVLVNNAAVTTEGRFSGPEAIAAVERVVATNFFGAVYCTAELLALLERSAPSSVVNVASMAGRIAIPGAGPYCASKFALVGWSESIEPELRGRGVQVSLIEPGFVPTEGFPQSDLVEHPVLRRVLARDADVSDAILDAIEHRRARRIVPRWYGLLELPRAFVPGPYRAVVRAVARRRT